MHNTFRRRLIFILMAAVAIWFFLWYTHSLVDRLNTADKENCETIAKLWAGVQYPLSVVGDGSGLMSCTECGNPFEGYESDLFKDTLLCSVCDDTTAFIRTSRLLVTERHDIIVYTRRLFSDIVARLEFPTIFSDRNGIPQIVDGSPVEDFSQGQIDSLRRRMHELSQINIPVPLLVHDDTIGFLFYGSSELNREMELIPFLELGLLLLIAAIIFFLLRSEIHREKDMSWVGFARETAHQISTPLSSLMGWLELLKDGEYAHGNDELIDAVDHMSADVRRLANIADRYGQMGREPRLDPFPIQRIITDTVEYFNTRKGLLGHGVSLESEGNCSGVIVMGNLVLLGWVLENLIKNAVAACAAGPDGGRVSVKCDVHAEETGMIRILISDNGCGIPYGNQGRIFNAGFTTRKGGWGLGLSLSRRIIEKHHRGSIRLVSSTPGKGTVFSIILPELRGGDLDNSTLGG